MRRWAQNKHNVHNFAISIFPYFPIFFIAVFIQYVKCLIYNILLWEEKFKMQFKRIAFWACLIACT